VSLDVAIMIDSGEAQDRCAHGGSRPGHSNLGSKQCMDTNLSGHELWVKTTNFDCREWIGMRPCLDARCVRLRSKLRVPWGRGYDAEGSSPVGEEAATLEDRLRLDPQKIWLPRSLTKPTNPK